MTPEQFIAKWQQVSLTERSAAQQHFLDLCELFEHPKPADADPTGDWFTFERGAAKHGGGDGWADVWKRGFFGWEYKGKHKDLDAAYDQLLQYREALENPPLLVVCDMDRLIVHTNFTATAAKTYDIPLSELAAPRNLEILRCVFHDPGKLKPGVTSEAITADAAGRLAEIAELMRRRQLDPAQVAVEELQSAVGQLVGEHGAGEADLLVDGVKGLHLAFGVRAKVQWSSPRKVGAQLSVFLFVLRRVHLARRLVPAPDRLRSNWLNPPEWTRQEVLEFPGAADGP